MSGKADQAPRIVDALARSHPQEIDRDALWTNLTADVSVLLNDEQVSERLEEWAVLDAQFRRGRTTRDDGNAMPWLLEEQLLITVVGRALGLDCVLPPSEMLPSDDPYDLWKAGWRVPDSLFNRSDIGVVTELHIEFLVAESQMVWGHKTRSA